MWDGGGWRVERKKVPPAGSKAYQHDALTSDRKGAPLGHFLGCGGANTMRGGGIFNPSLI